MYSYCILNFLVKALLADLLSIVANQFHAEIFIGLDNYINNRNNITA